MTLDETPRTGPTNSQLLLMQMGIDPNETPESLYRKVTEAQTKMDRTLTGTNKERSANSQSKPCKKRLMK